MYVVKQYWPYVLALVACAISYPFAHDLMARQEPYGTATISNVTVNLFLTFAFIGGLTTYLTKKLKWWKTYLILVGAIVTTIYMHVLMGYETVW